MLMTRYRERPAGASVTCSRGPGGAERVPARRRVIDVPPAYERRAACEEPLLRRLAVRSERARKLVRRP